MVVDPERARRASNLRGPTAASQLDAQDADSPAAASAMPLRLGRYASAHFYLAVPARFTNNGNGEATGRQQRGDQFHVLAGNVGFINIRSFWNDSGEGSWRRGRGLSDTAERWARQRVAFPPL